MEWDGYANNSRLAQLSRRYPYTHHVFSLSSPLLSRCLPFSSFFSLVSLSFIRRYFPLCLMQSRGATANFCPAAFIFLANCNRQEAAKTHTAGNRSPVARSKAPRDSSKTSTIGKDIEDRYDMTRLFSSTFITSSSFDRISRTLRARDIIFIKVSSLASKIYFISLCFTFFFVCTSVIKF